MGKRYLLFFAEGEVTDAEMNELGRRLKQSYGEVKVFGVEGTPRAVIVKTTDKVVPLLRNPEKSLDAGGKRLIPLMTSGAVGNLKRRAKGTRDIGKVHER